jgi:Haloacid Dehalogenase superfamily, subfamily IB, phosphoserine phosphatase-like
MARTHLHVFDMDGTLLRGAASVEIARHLGTYEEADRIEQAWLRGEITDAGFWERMLPLWAGMTEADIDAAFAAAAWIDGVREVFSDIRRRGEHIAVISQSPHFFVRRLEGWGAHRTYGTDVVPHEPQREVRMLTRQHKVDITMTLIEELGITEKECVAYGDSTSDTLLFERLPYSVGVNCSPLLRETATVCFDGDDIRGAYELGRQLLEGARAVRCPT